MAVKGTQVFKGMFSKKAPETPAPIIPRVITAHEVLALVDQAVVEKGYNHTGNSGGYTYNSYYDGYGNPKCLVGYILDKVVANFRSICATTKTSSLYVTQPYNNASIRRLITENAGGFFAADGSPIVFDYEALRVMAALQSYNDSGTTWGYIAKIVRIEFREIFAPASAPKAQKHTIKVPEGFEISALDKPLIPDYEEYDHIVTKELVNA